MALYIFSHTCSYDCVALEATTFNRASFASLSECYVRLVNADTNQVLITALGGRRADVLSCVLL